VRKKAVVLSHRNVIIIVQGWGMTETSPLSTAQEFSKTKFYHSRYTMYERNADFFAPPAGNRDLPCRLSCTGYLRGTRQKERNGSSGTHVIVEYYKDEDETRKRKGPVGLRNGDIACTDCASNLFICGRIKHVIVLVNGKKVFPEEDLSKDLAACPCIEEFTVKADRPSPYGASHPPSCLRRILKLITALPSCSSFVPNRTTYL